MTMMHSVRLKYIRPDASQLERGIEYRFVVENTPPSPGVILVRPGTTRWRYEPHPNRSVYSLLNLLRKPDFVLLDAEGQEVLRISRVTRFPARFKMIERGKCVGEIVRRSVLRNKYTIEFDGGPGWLFRMPLYTVHFPGVSSAGTRVWVVVGPSKRHWNVLVEHEADSVYLLCALAFIHREWWCYS